MLYYANYPYCTTIGSSAFEDNDLLFISFPACKSIHTNAFYGNSHLFDGQHGFGNSLYMREVEWLSTGAFRYCSGFAEAIFPMLTQIYGYAFQGCTNLKDLYIGTSNCKLARYGLTGCGITTTTGWIHVPEYTDYSYKHSAYWSAYSSRIVDDY